jgi:2-C-methyl-D-erythritol 4-phosphate cytidylyltransferase
VTVVAVVPAAGRGERLGAGRPKALVPVAGVAMVTRAVDGLCASGVVDTVVVAAPPGEADVVRVALGPEHAAVLVVEGGVDRVDSVERALAAAPGDADVVLVHDAARCLCPPEVVRDVVAAVRAGHGAVVPAVQIADTLKRTGDDGAVTATVDRAGLVGVQTPQGFAASVLRAAHATAASERAAGRPSPATDDAGLVEAGGGAVTTVPGDPRAFKITTALDLAMADALVATGSAAVSP